MQFTETSSKKALCPVCKKKEVVVRSTRGPVPYCSQSCASQSRYHTRYQGTMAGPLDRPKDLVGTTKFNG